MRYWAVNVPEVADFRDALLAGETRKVVYNHPWFWKCAASRTAKPIKTRVSAEPYIMRDDSARVTPPVARNTPSQRDIQEEIADGLAEHRQGPVSTEE